MSEKRQKIMWALIELHLKACENTGFYTVDAEMDKIAFLSGKIRRAGGLSRQLQNSIIHQYRMFG